MGVGLCGVMFTFTGFVVVVVDVRIFVGLVWLLWFVFVACAVGFFACVANGLVWWVWDVVCRLLVDVLFAV